MSIWMSQKHLQLSVSSDVTLIALLACPSAADPPLISPCGWMPLVTFYLTCHQSGGLKSSFFFLSICSFAASDFVLFLFPDKFMAALSIFHSVTPHTNILHRMRIKTRALTMVPSRWPLTVGSEHPPVSAFLSVIFPFSGPRIWASYHTAFSCLIIADSSNLWNNPHLLSSSVTLTHSKSTGLGLHTSPHNQNLIGRCHPTTSIRYKRPGKTPQGSCALHSTW